MDEQDVMAMMEQLGGMTALANADLPARIFATWANAFRHLAEAFDKMHLRGDAQPRVTTLMRFCIERMEMVAETQPKRRPTPEPDPTP